MRRNCGTLQWRYNEHEGVSNHQPHDCLLNRIFRRRSKKTSKFRVTGLCEGNSPVPGELPAQRASNAENVSISWRHHDQPTHWVKLTYMYSKFCKLGLYSYNDNHEFRMYMLHEWNQIIHNINRKPKIKSTFNVLSLLIDWFAEKHEKQTCLCTFEFIFQEGQSLKKIHNRQRL